MENVTQTNQSQPKPLPKPAAEMLGEIGAFLRQYVVCSHEQVIVLSVWILHAWMYRALPNTPYLNIQSPGPACGKTRLLQMLQLFAPPGSWYTSAPAHHFFMKKLLALKPAESPDKPPVHELPSVVLLDDREFTLGGDVRNPVIPFLTNGFRAANRYLYQHERSAVREFSVFCPKAFAGVAPLPRALAQRCIPIDLQRKLPSEKVEDFRWSYARTTAQPLLDWLKAWSELNLQTLAARANIMAMTPSERFNIYEAEFVRPLCILADLAGGKWLDNIHASLQWLKIRSHNDTAPEGLQVLADLRRVFDDNKNPPFLPTRDVIEELRLFEHRPWAKWRGNPAIKLSNLLRPFGIRPDSQRTGGDSVIRVYRREDFQDVWQRYV